MGTCKDNYVLSWKHACSDPYFYFTCTPPTTTGGNTNNNDYTIRNEDCYEIFNEKDEFGIYTCGYKVRKNGQWKEPVTRTFLFNLDKSCSEIIKLDVPQCVIYGAHANLWLSVQYFLTVSTILCSFM